MENSRRCKAHSSQTGQRCKKSAMLGQTVCRKHGGASPQAKKAARERLNDLVDPAIASLKKVLDRAIDSKDYAAIVRAAISILDRTGFHPSQSIELTGKDGGPIRTEHLLPVERLSLTCKLLIAAELDEGFVISPELERQLLGEIPPLRIRPT
jgi:hypothetical protein